MKNLKKKIVEGNKKKVDIVVSYPFHNKEKDIYLYVVIFPKANKTFYATPGHFRQVIDNQIEPTREVAVHGIQVNIISGTNATLRSGCRRDRRRGHSGRFRIAHDVPDPRIRILRQRGNPA